MILANIRKPHLQREPFGWSVTAPSEPNGSRWTIWRGMNLGTAIDLVNEWHAARTKQAAAVRDRYFARQTWGGTTPSRPGYQVSASVPLMGPIPDFPFFRVLG